jgi:hypothetical protein
MRLQSTCRNQQQQQQQLLIAQLAVLLQPSHVSSTDVLWAQEWRLKKGIDTILEQPQPAFDFAKGMYTHGVACFTKSGQPVWVDKIADLKRNFADFKVALRTAS